MCIDLADALKAAKLAERQCKMSIKVRKVAPRPRGDGLPGFSVDAVLAYFEAARRSGRDMIEILEMTQALHVSRCHPKVNARRRCDLDLWARNYLTESSKFASGGTGNVKA